MDDPTLTQTAPEQKHAHRAWSLYLVTIAGIPIFLHFTFILLLIFVGFWEVSQHQRIFGGVLFIICVFSSVALHELGHALMAKRFGIKTHDIVLYPIGGIARLRSMGEGFQEFWIAIAGPFVNVVIASTLWVILKLTHQWTPLDQLVSENSNLWDANNFWQNVAMVNIVLLVFNLIPAFPMDGGRVLRAILAQKLPREKATGIAAKIGQGMAIIFTLLGFLEGNPFLMFIGFFVFVAAGQEFAATRSAALLAGKHAGDAMITHFEILAHGDSLGRAADLLLATNQQEFPVMGGSEVLGILGRRALVQGLATHGRDHYVAEVMERNFPRMRPHDSLQSVFELMSINHGLAVLIFDGSNRLAGYINNENLMEYLLIAQTQPNH